MKLNHSIFPLITLTAVLIGGRFVSQGMGWFFGLNLPGWCSTGQLAGRIWGMIYILTIVLATVSGIILWNLTSDKWARWQEYYWPIWILFPASAFLNVHLNWLFFVKNQIEWAIREMIGLELMVIVLILLSRKFSKVATILLIPYAVWVAFTTYLAFQIWGLNK